jgi:opacity protein-like surface antigen
MKHKDRFRARAALAPTLSAAVLAFGVSAAQAGDLPDYDASLKDYAPVYEPVPLWIGFYIGVQGAYATGEWDGGRLTTADLLAGDPGSFSINRSLSLDADGWLGGTQAGYNDQFGPYVICLEGDFFWSGVDGSKSFTDTASFPGEDFTFNSKLSIDLDYFATARVRAGYAFDNWMIYATGGFAWAETEARLEVAGTSDQGFDESTRVDAEANHLGWTAGLGAEVMASRNISVKAEWLYVGLTEEDYRFDRGRLGEEDLNVARYESDLSFNMFRVGLNWRYSHIPEPVEAYKLEPYK